MDSDQPKANRGPSAGPENRRAIIAAAREVFAEEGMRAPLNAVARRAGVGQGSLYRHFPDRLALAVAVFDENINELEALVGAERSVDDLFLSISEQAMASTALIEIMTENQHDERAVALAGRVRAIVVALVAGDHEAGRIGGGATVDDVLVAITMLAYAVAYTPEPARPQIIERARRMFHAAFTALTA
ncbi:TetR/AcrR family transcriptional regulator [Micromonospora sp. DT81.3]|uniref:TetR/AcrR family transcriptional regulator n=1 Tax=Actinomycetes TaxID=1760 RepID=UPI003CEB80B6